MIQFRGRFFFTCAFEQTSGPDPAYGLPSLRSFAQSMQCQVGPHLLAQKDPVALRFTDGQCARLGRLVAQGVHHFERELAEWQAARDFLRS
jgi:hypothetical protein